MASSDYKDIKPKPGLNPNAPIFVPRLKPVIIEQSGHQILHQHPEIAPHHQFEQQEPPQFEHCNNVSYFRQNDAITRPSLLQEYKYHHHHFTEFPQNLIVHRNDDANQLYNNSNIYNDPNNRLHQNYTNSEYEDNLRYKRPHRYYETRNYHNNYRDNRSENNKNKFGKGNNSVCINRTSIEMERDFNAKTYSEKGQINCSNSEKEDALENSDIPVNNLQPNLSTTIIRTPDHELELNKSKTINKNNLFQENFVPLTEIPPNKEKENANSLTIVNSLTHQLSKELHIYESPNIPKYKLVDPRIEREKLKKNVSYSDLKSSNDVDRALEDLVGKEYDQWEKNYNKEIDNITDDELTVTTEICGNLFDQPKEYSLAHCVAEDLRMGMGIATSFKREFNNLNTLYDQKAKQGGLAVLNDEENNRFLYYLVTKKESTGKPTYLNLFRSLYKMRTHIKENKVQKLAIPRLGCGLDRLEWKRVKSIIEFLFKKIDLEIVICNFNPKIGRSKQNLEDTETVVKSGLKR